MTQHNDLSLTAAIIINLNIIIGSGIFINTTELAKLAGVCGGLSYAIIGLLLLPLILSFARLLQLNPGGGFYSFAENSLSTFAGFISTWCYFTTKLSSATLVIHVFVLLLQKLVPSLASYNALVLDLLVLSTIVCLNMLNLKTGSAIQQYLLILKLFPILLVIGSAIFFLQGANFSAIDQLWEGIPATIPLVLHAMLGFETACSISRNIKNPEVNGPRAVVISYALVILVYVLYQTLFYTIVGHDLAAQADYRGAFPLLINKFNISDSLRNFFGHSIHLAIALSALSAGLGMIYANMWNLYSLAERNHTFFPSFIMQRNYFNVPFICVLAQAVVAIVYLLIINGEQTTFQQLSAFGATVTYTISIAGLLATTIKSRTSTLLPMLGLINCAILLVASIYKMWSTSNSTPILLFSFLMIFGALMYTINSKKNRTRYNIL